MKKPFVIAVSMVVLMTAFASAQAGNGRGPGMTDDQGSRYGGYGPMHGGQRGIALDDLESETVSGRIQLRQGALPTVPSGGTTYALHIPRILTDQIAIRDGQHVSIEGYITTARSFDLLSEETILRVRALESEGTRVVAPFRGGRR